VTKEKGSFGSHPPGGLVTHGGVVEVDFEKLVEEFYMPLYRFALSLSRNESDAFDLTQQTFYAWAAKGHQLRDASKVKTWLFTTLYREFLQKKRRDDRFVETDEETVFAEPLQISPSIVNEIDAAIVQKALHQLDERYRAPVTLFYMEQHSYREIADILSLPIGTVMSRISRGKAELRRRLSDLAADEARKILPMKEGG
jgi:RNA polymerase sigma-70 factor (ECF subfamily)